jgi:hypothetical protein
VRSALSPAHSGHGRVRKGDLARHTLHVTPEDVLFAGELKGVGKCLGGGFAYKGEGSTITREHTAEERELLLFDHPLDTDGTYPTNSYAETEQVHVEVWCREYEDCQWEFVVGFDLGLEVQLGPIPLPPP